MLLLCVNKESINVAVFVTAEKAKAECKRCEGDWWGKDLIAPTLGAIPAPTYLQLAGQPAAAAT